MRETRYPEPHAPDAITLTDAVNENRLSPRSLATLRAIDGVVVHIARHWLLYAGLFLFVFSSLPFLAPILMDAGLTAPANAIYWLYSLTCHQLAYRSFFLDGAQWAYNVPQLQAFLHVDQPAANLLYWRAIVGNTAIGYKVAYCERDVAIYSSMFLATLAFALVRKRLPRLSWRWYLILAILPMLLDGGTQLVMLRESDPLLRSVTGVLFGVLSVWLIYPYVDAAMRETYAQTSNQLSRIRVRVEGEGSR